MASHSRITRAALTVVTLLIGIALEGCPSNASNAVMAEDALMGTWKVDLRPTPEAEPHYKDFVVTAVRGGTFEGTFYDTPISDARINDDWGKLRIAFVTTDGSAPYYHSATLEHGKLEGLSLSTGRGFLAYWTAVRK
jgi:hypothetical protein